MEVLKHECGVAMVRLLKPLEYYHQKYGTWMYGLNKLYLLMEKQHNRGQEGAGLACVKLEASPGEEYMFRERALGTEAITEIFAAVHEYYKDLPPDKLNDPLFAKTNLPFAGELYMGHLRYSITAIGQHPRAYADTFIMLEQVGHRLDREVERLYRKYEAEGMKGMNITHAIEANVDLSNVLKRCAPQWDGGFVICGLTGSGESFSVRDPWGIRPAFYYADDEIVILASERPVIQTAMNVPAEDVHELKRGEALIINKQGNWHTSQIVEPKENKACSFERIYFSRGSDRNIYRERKRLGENLVPAVLKAVDNDLNHTVFSFIPNTAEVAYFGLQEGMNEYLNKKKKEWIADRSHLLLEEELEQILSMRVRCEKVAIKDIKLRTFIAEGNSRNDLAAHVYDITYGSIVPFEDNLVVIDDSIVRGTTLRQSIIGILDRLNPKKIVVVSSSPQVRYPDYYGIDMSRMSEFIAFKAAVALLVDKGMESVLLDAYKKAKRQQVMPCDATVNYVKEIYASFTDEEISAKMVELLTPVGTRAKVEIVYQTLEGLHAACPDHPGDWYFSGDYPTPGGVRMVNEAFIHYMEEEYWGIEK